jgi:hypothetical protein
LIVVQVAGLLTFEPLYVVILSIALGIASYWIVARVAPRFSREGIINTF